jgi:hypothetical protein
MIVRLGRYREAKTACEKKGFFGASTDHQISACLSALPPRLLSAILGREVADGGRQERSEPTAIRITAICWIRRGRSLPTPEVEDHFNSGGLLHVAASPSGNRQLISPAYMPVK